MISFFVGVDVGTSSVRAALVDNTGKIHMTAVEPISIYNYKPDFFEQSSNEIWLKSCNLIQKVTKNIPKESIKGIGFDATCSLVVLDKNFQPIAVNILNNSEVCYDVIMWMDHRAKKEAEFINLLSPSILKYVGGKISLEMQPPKLKWLKENLPDKWKKAQHFFDLSDFLTFKATGCLSRSRCTVTCKWLFCDESWSKEFWTSIGLDDLCLNNFTKIGKDIVEPGCPLGSGLTNEAATKMNLCPCTPVGSALIDAHCGGIGTIGVDVSGFKLPCVDKPITERISFICGTSSCHMAISKSPLFVPGVWGPYYSAMIPGLWLNEGGQSATGNLIDHMIKSHPAYEQLQKSCATRNQNMYEFLNSLTADLAAKLDIDYVDFLTKHFHVTPDHHGNRSPLADPTMCGAVCGLTLDNSLDDLSKLYLATVQALAFGSRHIVDTLEASGHHISTVFLCGGLSKNNLFVQIHANVLDRPIVLGKETESVLLGAAILGACASKEFDSLESAMRSMSKPSTVLYPIKDTFSFYAKKYKVFRKMIDNQLEYKRIMEDSN